MNPTLRAGDELTVIPYRATNIRLGDVVVFRHPEGQYKVVHRVVSVCSEGVRTKGDNNIRMDPWVLGYDDIIGRIVSARRKNRSLTIHGGIGGRILAPVLLSVRQFKMTASKVIQPAYHMAAKSGILRRLLPLQQKMRVLSFNKPEGKEWQLLLGNRVIGRRLPGREQWQIARPFRLFINETSLPK
jgi:hypothetical protein